MDKEKFYITSSILYSTQKPHFGNTYEVIMCDAVARYKRQMGYDVFFLTGSDEHGQKVDDYSAKEGITPKAYVDKIVGIFKELWQVMNISYDKFIRTTDDYHEKAVQNIFKKLYEQGDIYKSKYSGWYCLPDESFFTETQVVDGKCPECGRPVVRMEEDAYKFKMSKYQDWLLEYIDTHPDFIEPESRKKEMINNFLKPGLQDLCLTRASVKWGIKTPIDENQVIYVWIDALSNYITALGYDTDKQGELYNKYWPADVHVVGKDIMRFHTIYWIIILKALGLPLPKKVFGHPWFNFGNERISKSLGNVVYADDLAKLFGTDSVRYYALSEMPYASDAVITYESFITRYNTDLANTLGNLVNRTLVMTQKYFFGIIPQPGIGTDNEFDADLKQTVKQSVASYKKNMDELRISDAVEDAFVLLRRANKYIDETTPWVLAKDEANKGKLGNVIYNLLETIRIGAVLLTPIIPETSAKILSQVNTSNTSYEFGGLESGNFECHIGEIEVLFNRLDEAAAMEQLTAQNKKTEPVKAAETEAKEPAESAPITIDDFMNVELRTATVLACEKVPKSKKLLKLQLDLGYEQRQVVSGIAKYYEPDQLIGRKVIVVANLKPAVLSGVESNGMILASGEEEVRVVFLDGETPNGERVR